MMIALTICLGVACILLAGATVLNAVMADRLERRWRNAQDTVDGLLDLLNTADEEYFELRDQLEAVEFQLEMALEREQDLLGRREQETLVPDLPPRPWNIAAQRCTFDPR